MNRQEQLVGKILIKNQYSFLKIYSSFNKSTLQFLFELEHIFFESFCFLHFSAHDIVLDCFLINLLNGQLAEILSCLRKYLLFVVVVNFPQTIFFKFSLFDGMFIFFIEYEVKDLFSFDISRRICFPEISGSNHVLVILARNLRNNHKFFQGIVQVFLIVVEW